MANMKRTLDISNLHNIDYLIICIILIILLLLAL